MPCTDGRETADQDLKNLTRFCCEILTATEDEGYGRNIPDYIQEWWKHHKAYDASCGRPHSENKFNRNQL